MTASIPVGPDPTQCVITPSLCAVLLLIRDAIEAAHRAQGCCENLWRGSVVWEFRSDREDCVNRPAASPLNLESLTGPPVPPVFIFTFFLSNNDDASMKIRHSVMVSHHVHKMLLKRKGAFVTLSAVAGMSSELTVCPFTLGVLIEHG